ncbi:MAG TPA: outer membrane beta-barrel protein [Flavobacteriales bacterium]|nr:outer membrane beta-barrel protein [Flavobacteriales bacterium]
MKKLLGIWILLNITGNAFTQMRLGDIYNGFFVSEKDSIPRQHRTAFDFTYEHWLTGPQGVTQKFSWGFAWSRMFEYRAGNAFSFAWGIGIRSLHHHHDGFYNWYTKNDNTVVDTFMRLPAGTTYTKNKIALNYADLLAEIRIKPGRDNMWRLYAGFRSGYLFNNHTKFKGDKGRVKDHKIPGYEKFSYGPTLRLGFSNLCLYVHYLVAPIYKNNSGQSISSVSAGLTLYFN